jgi:hypothetical protein
MGGRHMKRIIFFTLVLVNMVMSGVIVNAAMPDAVPLQKDKVDRVSAADEIVTAIDVVDLMQHGSSDADIAKLLSDRLNFDRESALKKGTTDAQIIEYLIADATKNVKNISDNTRSVQHKTKGDNHYKKSQYDKAAKEYTLAIRYSEDKYEPYKSRADTYKQYAVAKLSAVAGSDSDKAKQGRVDASRGLICNAIYADYTKAMAINEKTLSNITLEFNALKDKMTSENIVYDPNSNAEPYRYKSAKKTLNMRRLNQLNLLRRDAYNANVSMKKSLSDYKLVCAKEDAARGEPIRIEEDTRRDKK